MRRPKWYDYDSDLQMLREPPRDPDHKMLVYLHWLVRTGRLTDDTSPDPHPDQPPPCPLT